MRALATLAEERRPDRRQRFDRDLRSITSYLLLQTALNGDIREKFSRLQQISILLNLDSVCEFLVRCSFYLCIIV